MTYETRPIRIVESPLSDPASAPKQGVDTPIVDVKPVLGHNALAMLRADGALSRRH
jgi:hypothetical protein